jgi:pimeloyl-ACP methyl ester carboxylesterase
MRSLNTIIRISGAGLLSAVVTVGLLGCGHNSVTTPIQETPPQITVAVSPGSANIVVLPGGTQQFTATLTNDLTNKGVAWIVSCDTPPCGSVSPTSTTSGVPTMYTAPANAPPTDLYVTIGATSVAQNSASASGGLMVPAFTVSVTPVGALIPVGSAQQFTASVPNYPQDRPLNWTLTQNGAACSPTCGSLSASSTQNGTPTTYSAPSTMPTSPSVVLSAASVTDGSKAAAAAITLSSGVVQLGPNSMDFGHVLLKVSTSPQSTTLTNTASGALRITSITITGANAGDFAQTNTCPSSLDAGMSCTISVIFTPTNAEDRSAIVSIADDSSDSPQQVSLSGAGKKMPNMAAVLSALAGAGRVAVPIPTGPATVGTRILPLIDSTRQDPFLANGARRELLVRFWYPAVLTEACKQAPYTSAKVWSYLSQLAGVHLPEVTTNSCMDADMADGSHPIVVFTHGYTGTFTDYTYLFEDLASRGYVVTSLAHTYETTAVEFPDGRLVKSRLGSYLKNSSRGDNLAFAGSVRLEDLKFVLNELEHLNAKTGDRFAGKLDLSRVAIAGHSLGGTTAFLALDQDARFRAAIVLDGYVPVALLHPTPAPVLILSASQENQSNGRCRLWDSLRGPRTFVNLRGAEHLTPSDAIWLAKGVIKTGPMGPEKTVAVIREQIAGFMDANLREQSLTSSTTTPPSDQADLTVVRDGESPCREP